VFISNAYAQAPVAADTGLMANMSTFLPLILMFVVMYFLMIRPQQKRAKEQKQMMDALAKGDEVVTAGGILGNLCDDRSGGQYGDRGPEALDHDPAAKGHAQVPVSLQA
jgi:hypothetical protein